MLAHSTQTSPSCPHAANITHPSSCRQFHGGFTPIQFLCNMFINRVMPAIQSLADPSARPRRATFEIWRLWRKLRASHAPSLFPRCTRPSAFLVPPFRFPPLLSFHSFLNFSSILPFLFGVINISYIIIIFLPAYLYPLLLQPPPIHSLFPKLLLFPFPFPFPIRPAL